jgi:DNA uptake protein ComE-like DNA-binding protein
LFDPNIIGIDEWIQLGFSEKQALSIEKYKNAGAEFKIKSDVKKLFMVDEQKYTELEPYIDLPEFSDVNESNYSNYESYDYHAKDKQSFIVVLRKSQVPIYDGFEGLDSLYYTKRDQEYWYCILPFSTETDASNYQTKSNFALSIVEEVNSLKGFYPIIQKEKQAFEKKLVVVDINTADTLAFSKISGIGFGYARRIIKYRAQLGGFISIDQMKETYYLPPEVIDDHLANFKLDDKTLSKININIVEVSDLKMHPYITWNVANSIVQMRKAHGNFTQVSDIKKSDLINEELFLKIAPYLTIE